MKPNLGIVARYTRTALGLTALTYATSSRRKNSLGHILLVSAGAMKVAEGITGWCPLQYLTDVLHGQSSTDSANSKSSDQTNSVSNHSQSGQTQSQETEEDTHHTSKYSSTSSLHQEKHQDKPHQDDYSHGFGNSHHYSPTH